MDATLNRSAMPYEKKKYAFYQAPNAPAGTLVFYYPNCDKNARPWLGEITFANPTVEGLPPREVSMVVRTEGGDMHKDSVRHIGDPRCEDPRVMGLGCWEFRPPSAEILDLRARVARLEDAFGINADGSPVAKSAKAPIAEEAAKKSK